MMRDCKSNDFVVLEFKSAVPHAVHIKGEPRSMSEKHPECPLYNPLNCKEYYNPKLCAFVRKDKDCLKKKKPKQSPEKSEA